MVVLAAFTVLHTVDGLEVAVSDDQIVTVMSPRDGEGNKLMSAKVRCVITMSNGKFYSVAEDCNDVLKKIGTQP